MTENQIYESIPIRRTSKPQVLLLYSLEPHFQNVQIYIKYAFKYLRTEKKTRNMTGITPYLYQCHQGRSTDKI